VSEGNYVEAKRLLDYQEAADYLGIKKSTLSILVCRRDIECVKVGRRVYFTHAILDSYVERNTMRSIYETN
jgi:excisionase family DNA binding protein